MFANGCLEKTREWQVISSYTQESLMIFPQENLMIKILLICNKKELTHENML